MSANIKASTDGTQAIIGVGGVDQMTVSNAGVVTANSFVGNVTGGTISGNASSATALATGSTTARTLANRFADVANVKDFGAVGDGVADDTAAIQAAVNSLGTLGGMVFIPSSMRCRVNSSITLNEKCSLVGTSDNLVGSLTIVTQRGSSIILDNNATIIMAGRSTRIEGINIYKFGLVPGGKTAAEVIALCTGDAIEVRDRDCAIIKCTIIGFYNAIINYAPYAASRLFVSNVFIDCRNGITSQASGDVTRIENVHCWPILGDGEYDSWLNTRTGLVAFNFNTFQDWTKLTNCFCFGYETGYKFENASTVELIGCQADYPPATPAGNAGPTPSRVQTPNGSSGISISGLSNTISIVGCVTAGSDVGIKVNSTSGQSSIQIDCSHGNTHLVSCIENIYGYLTINNYTARTGVSNQGIGVQTRITANITKISDCTFRSLEYGIVQDSASTPLFITNPTYIISLPLNYVVNSYIASVASTTVMRIDGESNVFNVTGNTNISDLLVQDDYAGKIVVLKFLGTLTVFDNTTTLRLNGNLNATPGTTLTLVSDGLLWYEVARSIN
jgi:hypothetical protein